MVFCILDLKKQQMYYLKRHLLEFSIRSGASDACSDLSHSLGGALRRFHGATGCVGAMAGAKSICK